MSFASLGTVITLASFAFGIGATAWALVMRRELARSSSAALIDPLTGLFNRRGWSMLVERETARAAREKTALTIFYMDVDDFKAINDEEGHAAGDAMLVRIASDIRTVARAHDVVARFGGDEFAVLASDDGSSNFPEGLLGRWASAFALSGARVSIGFAPVAAGDDGNALARADEAMYLTKARTKRERTQRVTDSAPLTPAFSKQRARV
jgi:GGDEF domain-containing protein